MRIPNSTLELSLTPAAAGFREGFHGSSNAQRGDEPAPVCSAVLPDCGFDGRSIPSVVLEPRKAPELAGWKACAMSRFRGRGRQLRRRAHLQGKSPCLAAMFAGHEILPSGATPDHRTLTTLLQMAALCRDTAEVPRSRGVIMADNGTDIQLFRRKVEPSSLVTARLAVSVALFVIIKKTFIGKFTC